jgi:chromosome partitioning protein
MVDRRSKFTREVISLVENTYGGSIRIFSEAIPNSVRAAESHTSVTRKRLRRNDEVGARRRINLVTPVCVREVLGCA